MKIVLLGNGFLAHELIQSLENQGFELLICSRHENSSISSRQLIGDIFDDQLLIEALKWEPKVLINTAWITSHNSYMNDERNYAYSQFSKRLAQYSIDSTLEHIIAFGSCAEYGTQSSPSVAGVTKLAPSNLYALQKMEALYSMREILAGSKIRLTWARIFQPYGRNQDPNRLVPYLINAIRSELKIELRNSTAINDWITTIDIASAISWVIHNQCATEIDIGTGIGHSNYSLVQKLLTLMGKSCDSLNLGPISSESSSIAVVGNASPIFKSGWRPKYDLDSGLSWVLGK